MDHLGLPDRLCEMDESDLNDFYNFPMELGLCRQDGDDQLNLADLEYDVKMEAYADETCADWMEFLDDPVVNDKMMSEAGSPLIKTDHSYSTGKDSVSINGIDEPLDMQTGPETPKDPISSKKIKLVDSTVVPQPVNIVQVSRPSTLQTSSRPATSRPMQTITVVKQEPRLMMRNEPIIIETKRPPQTQQSLLKPQAVLLNRSSHSSSKLATLVPKRESIVSRTYTIDSDEGIYLNVMPLTPPGSNSSDSEQNSPQISPRTSPIRPFTTKHREINPATAIYSQPIPTSGVLVLTEEEKRTLISEGYPIPHKLPLSKMEEKNLKKVRRKIKNKISAQESRRKRKEYMDHLEKKMDDINRENTELKKKCDQFESSNANLMSQLSKLQAMFKRIAPNSASQTGVCVMVLVLCFAVFFGHWSDFSLFDGLSSSKDADLLQNTYSYAENDARYSRTLLSVDVQEKSCGVEPWPVLMARKSYESIAGLLMSGPVGTSSSYSNESNVGNIFVTSPQDPIYS